MNSGNKSVASLMQRALDRQASLARSRFKLEPGKIQQVLMEAFQNKNFGPYNELVNILREWPLNDENFSVLVVDLCECVSWLGRESRALVEGVCGLVWADRCPKLVHLYSSLLIDLATAHNYYTPLIISSLVKLFKVGDDVMWQDEPSQETTLMWSNAHEVIAKIVAMMPMSSEVLLHSIIEQFPYHKAGSYAIRAYVHNLIWITKYIPSLMESIATVIVTRMIIMDVNTTTSLKKDEASKIESDIFSMDLDEKQSECDVAEALDYCMLEMLNWLQAERNHAFDTICTVFERVILPTHGTCHIQFLLLYTISINQKCADRVLSNLWKMAAGLHNLGPGAVATRRTAAAHLAGLLARCHRLPRTRLSEYMRAMADWSHGYVTATQEVANPSDNARVHAAFFAICHALFYLVAFKHHQLFSSKESINFVESLNLPRLVSCPLNPLRTCCPGVLRAFSSVTRQHQVVYCQPIIEKNNRYSINHHNQESFDVWFPYDPYTLPKSGKLIWPLYVDYREWSGSDVAEENNANNKSIKLEADDDFLVLSSSFKLSNSFSNGTSPGFKYL